MRFEVIFASFLVCFGLTGFCQNQGLINAIKIKLKTAEGSSKFDLLNELAWQYRAAYPDSAIFYSKNAYTLGQRLKASSLARSLNYTGIAYNYRGDALTAYEYYNLALKTAIAQNDLQQQGHSNNNIGRLFLEQGMNERAQSFFNIALATFQKINDSSGVAFVYQSFGTLGKLQKSYRKAENNFLRAYGIRLKLKDTKEIMSAQTQLGKFYQDEGDFDKALRYFYLADSTGNVTHNAINLAEVKTLIAGCYLHKGQLEKAAKISLEGLQYILKTGNRRLLPEAYLTIGQIFLEKGDVSSAKSYFILALQVSTTRKDLNAKMSAYYMLWKSFEKEDDHVNSLKNFNEYLKLKDSIFNLEAALKDERLNFEMTISRQYQQVERLRLDQEKKKVMIAQQRVQNTILIVVIVSISIILFLLWRIWRRTQKSKERIEHLNSLLNKKNVTLENHLNTLLAFSKNQNVVSGYMVEAAKDIARVTANCLNVSRVSIWLYMEEYQCINSLAAYTLQDDCYLETEKLMLANYPIYFNALMKEKVVIVNDAEHDIHTIELYEEYLKPLNIKSMLDSIFFIDGKLKGLICLEQQEACRIWSSEDIIFVNSVVDIMSLTFRAAQRREHAEQIIQHNLEIEQMNEQLEERVRKRTEELRQQNEQLSEYAFINSHLLRGPLSRILGLINIMEKESDLNAGRFIELLRKSGKELDAVIHKITDSLQRQKDITREDFANEN